MELVTFFYIKPTNSINIPIKFIKLYSLVERFGEYAPRVYRHMSLMAKVNHLAWFNGPMFHDANLGSTLPLEIPTVYS